MLIPTDAYRQISSYTARKDGNRSFSSVGQEQNTHNVKVVGSSPTRSTYPTIDERTSKS